MDQGCVLAGRRHGGVDGIAALAAELCTRYTFLDEVWACRLVRAYGTDAASMLGSAASLADLGQILGATLSEREVDWLIAHEWAQTADDVLWRRSKLGVRFSPDEAVRLDQWMRRKLQFAATARTDPHPLPPPQSTDSK